MNKNKIYLLEDRVIIYVSGKDASDFLQNIISNDIKKVNPKLKKDVKNVDVNHVYVKNKFIVIKLHAAKKEPKKRKRNLNLVKENIKYDFLIFYDYFLIFLNIFHLINHSLKILIIHIHSKLQYNFYLIQINFIFLSIHYVILKLLHDELLLKMYIVYHLHLL